MGKREQSNPIQVVAAEFSRPASGHAWARDDCQPWSRTPGWQGNGGPTRDHPARGYPYSFEALVPDRDDALTRIRMVGVFALHGGPEPDGAPGATVQLLGAGHEPLMKVDLMSGRHYGDARSEQDVWRVNDDGTFLETIGHADLPEGRVRVDALTFDVPVGVRPRRFRFASRGTPASFVVFDVFFEFEDDAAEPGREPATLGDLATAIRIGDRVLFGVALEHVERLFEQAETLDEARGLGLGAFGLAASAMLEGAVDARHIGRAELEIARAFETLDNRAEVLRELRQRLTALTGAVFAPSDRHSDRLIDRALAIVDRQFARDLTDAALAAQLGLSTSHFRFLFRQATGMPFHKYVVAVRLEKARRMLVEQEITVSEVAAAVGFGGLSHFSRAFTQRFSASPTHIRRAAPN